MWIKFIYLGIAKQLLSSVSSKQTSTLLTCHNHCCVHTIDIWGCSCMHNAYITVQGNVAPNTCHLYYKFHWNIIPYSLKQILLCVLLMSERLCVLLWQRQIICSNLPSKLYYSKILFNEIWVHASTFMCETFLWYGITIGDICVE